MVAEHSEREMVGSSVAPNSGACADGDVARCANLRFAFEMANRRQRHGAPFLLRDPVRPDRVVAGRPNRLSSWDRHHKSKNSAEARVVSFGDARGSYHSLCQQPTTATPALSVS